MTVAFAASSMFGGTFTLGPITAGPTSFNYGNGGGQPTVPLTFNQYTLCPGCTLQTVEIDYSVALNTSYSVTNTSGSAAKYTITSSAIVDLDNSATTLVFDELLPFHSLITPSIANTVTSTGSDIATASASAIFDASGNLMTYNGGGIISNPVSLAAFFGTGTFTLDARGSFTGSIGGTGFNGSVGGTGSETASIIFTYSSPSTTTPEPATMTLFGSALLGIGFFARKRNKKS
jgi:hypothetical protein